MNKSYFVRVQSSGFRPPCVVACSDYAAALVLADSSAVGRFVQSVDIIIRSDRSAVIVSVKS